MGYCSSCGEPVEGRFCRMCGTLYAASPETASPYAGFTAEAPVQTVGATALQSTPQYMAPPQYADPSQYLAAPQYTAQYTGSSQYVEPTQVVTPQLGYPQPQPQPQSQPDSDFESLFRQPEGVTTPHSLTQLIPPVDDYRMPPPAAPNVHPFGGTPGQPPLPQSGDTYPPRPGGGAAEDWDDDGPAVRKPVLWGTIGAVVAASAVILGLLYIGSHNNGTPTASGSTSSPTAVASTQPTIGSVNLPSGSSAPSASASPSALASPSTSAATGGTNLPLTQGSTGAYVRYVQNRLRTLGYYDGDVTGQYDAATAQAVINFQGRAGVTGDPAGTVGRSTLTALISAGSKPNLRPGQHSGDVKRLQQALNSAENAGLNVNGRYDAATAGAVLRYQSQVGVQPTGSMNGQTWAALQSGTIIG